MSAPHPTRSAVVLVAIILAVLLLAPQPANACGKGSNYSGLAAAYVFGAGGAVALVDVGIGLADIHASVYDQRISKLAAAIQLALMIPQLVFETALLSALSAQLSGGDVLIGLALMTIPLSLAIYDIYVLATPDPKASLTARLEKGFGIELPAPKIGGIERVMLSPTAISLTNGAGPAREFKTNQSTGSLQLAPGVALAFRF